MAKKEDFLAAVILVILIIFLLFFIGGKLPDVSNLGTGIKDILGIKLSNVEFNLSSLEDFCGDGKCSKDEEGICQLDCDWCGDGFCKTDESCLDCSLDCGECSSPRYCGDNICDIGECKSACMKDCSFSECENGVCENEKGENCVSSPSDCSCDGGYCDSETSECVFRSCGNGECNNGETFLNCPEDCYEEYINQDNSDEDYPIILLHGHSLTESRSYDLMNSFKDMHDRLTKDGYVVNKGILLPKGIDVPNGSWGRFDKPIAVRTTFYLNTYDEFGASVGPEDNKPLSVYASRLAEVIDNLRRYTGKKKVIILAQSMGGLVAREYIKEYGSDKVDKLVMFGTPNHGVYETIASDCYNWFGGQIGVARGETSPECEDMKAGSNFLKQLNSGDETPGDTKYLSIIGNVTHGKVVVYKNIYSYNVCPSANEYHDEVVCVSSAYIDGAENYYIQGNEVPGAWSYHELMIHPADNPEAYQETLRFLEFV